MRKAFSETENTTGFFSAILKPLFVSLVLTFLSLCLLAILIVYGPVTEKAADLSVLLATAVCILICGFLAGRQGQRKGLLRGAAAGILYVLAAYIVAALAFGSLALGGESIKLLGMGAGLGALGGIFGINTRRKAR